MCEPFVRVGGWGCALPVNPAGVLVRGYGQVVPTTGAEHTPEGFFTGSPDGLALFAAVQQAVSEVGDATVTVTKSQIAFRRRKGFAYVWRPGQYLASDVPAVLSIPLPYEVASDRFKSVAHPASNVWMHHLELFRTAQIDADVRCWLSEAYDNAG